MAGWTGAQVVAYEFCLLLVDMAGWTGAQVVEYEFCLLLVDIGWLDWSSGSGI